MNARKILAALVVASGATSAFAAGQVPLEGPNAVPVQTTQIAAKTRAQVNAEQQQAGTLQSLNGPYLFVNETPAAPVRAKAAEPLKSSEAPVVHVLG